MISKVIIVIQLVILICAVRVIREQSNALKKLMTSREAVLDMVGDLMIHSTECQSDRLRLQASLQTCSTVVEPSALLPETILERVRRSASFQAADGSKDGIPGGIGFSA